MAEELETVLRLVAEGRLTPDEAAPIIEALTRAERPVDDFATDLDEDLGDFDGLDRLGERIERRIGRSLGVVGRRLDRAGRAGRVSRAGRVARAARLGGGRQLRIKVTENGRQVVNLRIPIAFVETALEFVPGLGGAQSERIRDAVRAGATGPIVDVEDPDGGSGVLISVE